MKNLLLSAAIGDIAGMPYEFSGRTKDYESVNLLLPSNTYTDDTVCTFACAESLLKGIDMAENLWNRCRADFHRGFGGRFARWLIAKEIQPSYHSYGNGSGMRVSAAGFMAKSKDECIELATRTALPTHDHPEGIKGAVATALAIYYGMQGKDKDFIRHNVLDEYYPNWSELTYAGIKPGYGFDETCQQTIPAALICFLESKDYVDCLKLAISIGGDADTLAAISGPMAYAFYREIPEELIENAKTKLPEWMLEINEELDNYVNNGTRIEQATVRTYNDVVRPDYTPTAISSLKADEVFVFGSNLYGHHGGGAARVAMNNFGAIWGQGVGLQGQSYAIPTMQGGVETIKPYVDQFIDFAKEHSELFFYVTRIGCGIAGFKDSDIAPLFQEAMGVENICLPKEFVQENGKNVAKPSWNAEKDFLEEYRVLMNKVRDGDMCAYSHIKELRAKEFQNTISLVNQGYFVLDSGEKYFLPDDSKMMHNTIFYENEIQTLQAPQASQHTIVKVENKDCLYAGVQLKSRGYNPAVLNMASRSNPGGGVLTGAGAQEETLFRRTNLFRSLYQFASYASEYGIKRHDNQYPLNRNFGGIYTPTAIYFRESEQNGYKLLGNPITLSFITVAAINRPDLASNEMIASNHIEPTKNKIRTILRIGLVNGHDSLVLGAFGCGAFCNPPRHMAKLFHEVLREGEFANKYRLILFAILDDHNAHKSHNPEGNFKPFAEEFATF